MSHSHKFCLTISFESNVEYLRRTTISLFKSLQEMVAIEIDGISAG